MSWRRNRSRYGAPATSCSSSGTSAACRPRARSASIRSSSASREALRDAWRQMRQAPQRGRRAAHRARGPAHRRDAPPPAPVQRRARRRRVARKRSRSSSPSATRSRYPGGCVTSRSPSSLRRRPRWFCRDASADDGGVSPQTPATSRSTETTRFASSRSSASTARRRSPPSGRHALAVAYLQRAEDPELHRPSLVPATNRA